MVSELVESVSRPGDTILDPFCGSGTVLLEGALNGRNVVGTDTSKYAVVLSKGKLSSPRKLEQAQRYLQALSELIPQQHSSIDDNPPDYVRALFHPKTLSELIEWRRLLIDRKRWFLLSCLLGRLHHRRIGAMSYPSGHHTPYLLNELYSRDKFPELYGYRPVQPRLLSKLKHAMADSIPSTYFDVKKRVVQAKAQNLPLPNNSVDAVITCPPYGKTLDYGRDNRVRLWFCGNEDWRTLDSTLEDRKYWNAIETALDEIKRVLVRNGILVLIIGNKCSQGKPVGKAVTELVSSKFALLAEVEDSIRRKSRPNAKGTSSELILVARNN
jgi:DNA modification methylase